MSLPTVSVTIAQWGKTDLTLRAVDALRRSDYPGEVEILVYDNASPGGPGRVAERGDITLVRGDENIGFGPAHNALAARAGGDYLLILNNDTIVDPRCIGRLVARMGAGDRPGVVSPQYRDFDGTTLEMGAYLGPDGSAWQLFRGRRPPEALERMTYPAHYGSAACLLVDKALFDARGGFDDAFAPAYYEDVDLCLAFAEQGRPSVVEPSAVVYHYEGGTAGKDLRTGLKTYQVKHRTILVQRWGHRLAGLPAVSYETSLMHALAPPGGGARILWATPHLPRPDRDAGSARLLQMIEPLQQAGHLVAVWAEHAHDADRYGRLLEARGIPWFAERREPRPGMPAATPRALSPLQDVLASVRWDAVIIAFPDLIRRLTPLVRTLRPYAAVIGDPVDLHFLREARASLVGIDHEGTSSKEEELAGYRQTDGVITASDHETEVLIDAIPGLAAHTFAMSAEAPSHPEEPALDGSLLFLGNFHHHPNVDAVDWWVSEIGPEVARLAGRPIPLRVVGAGSDGYRDAWASDLLDLVGWVEDLTDEFGAARAFLAPLRYGAGTKGKITTALARGVPTVTTPIGAEGMAGNVVDTLSIADDAAEIAAMVVRLMTDDDALADQRARGIAAAEAAWRRQQALSEEFADWVGRRIRAKI